jgi:recombination associated protein RdgC
VFKNLVAFRINSAWSQTLGEAESGLAQSRFVECAPSQEKSVGWTEPRGEEHGALIESVGGQWMLKLVIESKSVPGSVLKRKLKERLTEMEHQTGRKPGKKEQKEMKEEIRLDLLPNATPKQTSVQVWIDLAARLLMVDASSKSKIDEVVSCLVRSLGGLAILPLNTNTAPAAAMAEWLTSQEAPGMFTVDQDCELKACDESKAVVRYSRHPLDIEEVKKHVEGGKLPTRLAMTWDNRVSMVLTESLQIKKLTFLDVVFEGGVEKKEDGFDANVVIATGELRKLMPDLIDALGGEVALA